MILALNCDAWRSLWYLCMFSFSFFLYFFWLTLHVLFQCLEHHLCSTPLCHSFITIFYVNRGQKPTSVYSRLGYLQDKQLKIRVSPTHRRYKLAIMSNRIKASLASTFSPCTSFYFNPCILTWYQNYFPLAFNGVQEATIDSLGIITTNVYQLSFR